MSTLSLTAPDLYPDMLQPSARLDRSLRRLREADTLFYEIFRRWPALPLDLAGLDPAAAPRYVFRAEEIKRTAFRLDGLLAPPDEGDEPWVFVEVQFQPDESLYRRLFAEIFLFLHRATKPRPWRALILYPEASVERIPLGYASLLGLPEVQRVDLMALRGQERPTPGWPLLSLILDEPDAAIARARRLRDAEPRLAEKFGPPDSAVRQRIQTADADTLLRWSERILTATTLDEILAD